MGSKERNIILIDHSETYSPTIISGLLFHYILLFKKLFPWMLHPHFSFFACILMKGEIFLERDGQMKRIYFFASSLSSQVTLLTSLSPEYCFKITFFLNNSIEWLHIHWIWEGQTWLLSFLRKTEELQGGSAAKAQVSKQGEIWRGMINPSFQHSMSNLLATIHQEWKGD